MGMKRNLKDLSPFPWSREMTGEGTVSDFILVHYYLLYMLLFIVFLL